MFVLVAELFASLLRVKLLQPQFQLCILWVHVTDTGIQVHVFVPERNGVRGELIWSPSLHTQSMSFKIVMLKRPLQPVHVNKLSLVNISLNSFQAL